MNIKNAMIIKTNTNEQTEKAKKLRDLLSSLGQDVVLVPYGVNELFITIQDDNELAVIVSNSEREFSFTELDLVTGFPSVADCRAYAEMIKNESGLSEDCIDAEVWEVE